MGFVFNIFLLVFSTHPCTQMPNEQDIDLTVTLGGSSVLFESVNKGKIKQLSLS